MDPSHRAATSNGKKRGNAEDHFAVAVVKVAEDGSQCVVGHIPIVANRPVLTGTVPFSGLLSRSCPVRAIQTGGVAHVGVWSHVGGVAPTCAV